MSFTQPDDNALRALFARVKTIAVVGLSPQPVRPLIDEVLGEQAYARLADIPFAVDLVDVFRAAEHVPAIVDACLALHLPAIWIQEGIVHEASAQQVQAGGMTVVMDRCLLKEYVRLNT